MECSQSGGLSGSIVDHSILDHLKVNGSPDALAADLPRSLGRRPRGVEPGLGTHANRGSVTLVTSRTPVCAMSQSWVHAVAPRIREIRSDWKGVGAWPSALSLPGLEPRPAEGLDLIVRSSWHARVLL